VVKRSALRLSSRPSVKNQRSGVCVSCAFLRLRIGLPVFEFFVIFAVKNSVTSVCSCKTSAVKTPSSSPSALIGVLCGQRFSVPQQRLFLCVSCAFLRLRIGLPVFEFFVIFVVKFQRPHLRIYRSQPVHPVKCAATSPGRLNFTVPICANLRPSVQSVVK
jgi:hypothetical protein